MSAFNEYGDCTNPIYKELRTIYCCTGAEFCRPTLEHAWEEIERLEKLLKKADRLAVKSDQLEKKSACGYNYVRIEFLAALKDYQEERNK